MATPAQWRELEAAFRAEVQKHGDPLVYCWISTRWYDSGDQWYRSSADTRFTPHERDIIAARFCDLAQRGAVLLGREPNEKGLFLWLDSLRTNRSAYFVGRGESVGAFGRGETGQIRELFRASAELCYTLQTEALAAHSADKESVDLADAVSPDPDDTSEPIVESREAVVLPILRAKGMTRSRWATNAGVDPSVVYDYLKGVSNPRPESRNALAEVLGLRESELPK